MSRSHALPPFCCHTSDWGGAASKLSIWRTLGKNNFFARQFSVNFQWGLMYICKVHQNPREGKEISRPNKVMVCGRLHGMWKVTFCGKVLGQACEINVRFIPAWVWLVPTTYGSLQKERRPRIKNVGQLSGRAYNMVSKASHLHCIMVYQPYTNIVILTGMKVTDCY